MRPYDHARRAGNEGDVVKHLALFAALDAALTAAPGLARFVYCDMYAGRASTTLAAGGEWDRGIHALWRRGSGRPGLLADFRARHLRVEPGVGSVYPGSVSVAAERVLAHGRELVVKAWDVAPACVESVRAAMPGAHVVLGAVDDHLADAADADLVLFDPPLLSSWATAGRGVLEARTRTTFVGWLPCRIMDRMDGVAAEARALACDVLRVRYGGPTTPSGCMLVVRGPEEVRAGVRRVVLEVSEILGWSAA